MTDIRLNRTFWPVGHGAFYTERFYDHVDRCLFTAIYDCGSGNRWLKVKHGQRYLSTPDIKELFEGFMPPLYAQGSKTPIQDIDLAFVSHLHADHINGFPVLLPRIKKLVLPYLSDCKIMEALLYNAISGNTNDDGEINPEGEVDVDSQIQQFILNLAQRNVGEETMLIEIGENEENSPEEPTIDINDLATNTRTVSVPGGTSLRVLISPDMPFFWLYKPVNVDFSQGICDQIVKQLEQYAPNNSIKGDDNKIDWNKVIIAMRRAGVKNLIDIYKRVFGIGKDSSLHNSYSMPVYSGPAESTVDARVRIHLRSYVNRPLWRAMLCEFDIFSHPFYPGPMLLGQRCKLMSCLYMGDFNASDDKKYDQLRRILGEYYDRIGIQQVPHHFSGENRRAELYRGPYFAFGNISGAQDRSFKREVIDKDIIRFGCHPLIIAKNFRTMVKFEYEITIC